MAGSDIGDKVPEWVISAISSYRLLCGAIQIKEVWNGTPLFLDYDIGRFPSVSRYEKVKLCVVENFLWDADALKNALEVVVEKCRDEDKMYETVKRSAKFAHDEPDFNLRRLMTNAGFWVGSDPGAAWRVFKDWVERYIAALCNPTLCWHNSRAFHYLPIQNASSINMEQYPNMWKSRPGTKYTRT